MDGTARRRSGSFRQDDDEDVQFLTPHYGNDPGGPEPLDFSKLDLHLEGDDKEDYDEDQEERDQELIISRGRSRSRSVHEYDDNNASVLPDTVPKHKAMSAEEVQELEKKKHAEKGNGNATPAAPVDRTGPLQHREVVALQKGLEEATHTFTKGNSREDEEERMAADAEKRKRMLAASNHLPTSKDAEPNRRVKLLLLGDSGVGKSSLIMRWTLDSFSPSLTSTVGVNFKSKKINYSGELIQVQVWDTAGQENFHKITTSYYKGAQGIMLVYDVADQKSLDNVEYWIKNIKAHASDSVQVVLVGNKIDLRQVIDSNTGTLMKCVDTERGKEIAKKFSVPFFEASAKDSSHVDEAFLTLVHQIIEMSTPKHHSAVRASLQGGVERKNLDIRSSVGNSNNSGSQSPPNHSLNKDNNFNNANKAGDNSAAGGNKESKMLKSLGLKKNSANTPDKANVANSNNNGNGATATAGNGEDKEKCIIS